MRVTTAIQLESPVDLPGLRRNFVASTATTRLDGEERHSAAHDHAL
jgi:hypothetical protein